MKSLVFNAICYINLKHEIAELTMMKFEIQGVPLTTVYFQRHTAPTKIIRFQKFLIGTAATKINRPGHNIRMY